MDGKISLILVPLKKRKIIKPFLKLYTNGLSCTKFQLINTNLLPNFCLLATSFDFSEFSTVYILRLESSKSSKFLIWELKLTQSSFLCKLFCTYDIKIWLYFGHSISFFFKIQAFCCQNKVSSILIFWIIVHISKSRYIYRKRSCLKIIFIWEILKK